jgi:hypothetical protein
MKWILRSAFAAASLGSVAPALAQDYVPPMVAPMVPPAAPGVEEGARAEQSRGGFASALPVPPPPATSPLRGLAGALPDCVPAASGPKRPPARRVQWAVEDHPASPVEPAAGSLAKVPALASLAPLVPRPPVSPDEPPSYLPPPAPSTEPVKEAPSTALPAPPAPGPLPAIPDAPPVAVASPEVGAEQKPGALPALPGANPNEPGAQLAPAVAPAVAPEQAPGCQSGCDPTDRVSNLCDPARRLFPQDGPVRLRGWLDGGYVYNPSNPASKFNGPYNSVDRTQEPMFNQLYAILDRPLPAGGAWGAGFRADVLYGYDYWLGQSRGFEADRDFNPRWNGQYYGLALPQLYGEVGNDILSLKLGHFYSLVGYEALPAVSNFFYSHAYSYQFGQPITNWGGVVTTQFTPNFQAQVGVVNGWDALVGRTNNANFTGRLLYTSPGKLWWASAAIISGDEQTNPALLPNVVNTVGNRTRYDLLLGLTPGGLCGRWEYVFHHYYGWQEFGTAQGNYARWYGIDQYLYYRVSRTVRWGTRFEWFRDEDGTQVGLKNRPANPNNPPLPGNYFSLTTGLNYTPRPNFVLRPEIRWDFTSDTLRPAFSDGRKNNQLLLGCDLIWLF